MSGTNENKFLERMAFIVSEAPEELKCVLTKVRMDQDWKTSMKSLGCSSLNSEVLGKTLAYLMGLDVIDKQVTRLLKQGLQEMICRKTLHLMPEQCRVCLDDYHFSPGEIPRVRCRRCERGACPDCYPVPRLHWSFLCNECDIQVGEQMEIKEDKVKSKERKDKTAASQNTISQNNIELIKDSQDDDEDDDEKTREEENRKKKENEEGGQNKENEKVKTDDEKIICKSFKFGGKCPHGMSGKTKHGKWSECKWLHPKVCNKLLSHGTKGSQGCNGKDCEKYHPRMCYGSMSEKVCTKEKCTYWHCKGTKFESSSSSYSPPSRYSPTSTRSSRSPARREEGERTRSGRSPARRREVEERTREQEPRNRREEERRNSEEMKDEQRKREDERSFLDLKQWIKQEIKQAVLGLLPVVGSGSGVTQTPMVRPSEQGPTLADVRTYLEVVRNTNSSN